MPSDGEGKVRQVNIDEIDAVTGFKKAELYVWNAYAAAFLAEGGEPETDVEAWIDDFCQRSEESGAVFDRNFVKSVCTLGIYAGPRDEFQQRSGCGKATYASGDTYEGEFFEGKKHGRGQYIFVSKGRSEADRVVSKEVELLTGAGKDAKAMVAEIANKLQLGRHVVEGVMQYGQRPCYHGDYVRGKRTGRGVMKNKDGTLYQGEFLENKRHGQGVYYYLNGDVYSGNWKAGAKDGYGTYHFADGSEYRGEWVRGNFVQGQWILQGGSYYEGKFDKKNRPLDDAASLHYPSIQMAQTGAFKRGVWAPTSALQVCSEVPVDGMAWTD
ncbi:hypothetical protein, conserved [Leishmania donovani]|uniref:MORN repeat, putative n=1 Tax=Leishmania donovani TaxID=5661 RepID=E9B7W5_LEIDO|nr:hypothetical protein, conserved [Leishmania donovani]AYU75773.1 MORN repeat, putative [Leishmania donovani]CBZ31338.1 hypothetical protein, conserved [Leishmania donovani]